MLQIGGNRGADIVRQRHGGDLPSLAPNGELTGAPIDIIEAELRHFTRAQTQPGEQHQDRIVSSPRCGAPVATVEDALNALDRQETRQSRFARPPDRGDRSRQIGGDEAFGVQIPQEYPQARTHDPGGRRSAICGMPLDIERHLAPGQATKVGVGGDTQFLQEGPKEPQVARDRRRCEAPLARHVAAIGITKILVRITRRHRAMRDGVRFAQGREQPSECTGVPSEWRAVPRPLGEILRDGCFVDISETSACGAEPKTKILYNAQPSMACLETVAALLKLGDVEMDVFAERTCPQAPHYPASTHINVGDHDRSSAHVLCVGSRKLCRADYPKTRRYLGPSTATRHSMTLGINAVMPRAA